MQAREQQRLAPVERAEERVLDRDVEPRGRLRGAHALEQRPPLPPEDLQPRVRRAQRRVLDPAALAAGGRRPALEDRHDAAAEVRVGSDDVRQHLVGAPLLGLRPLGEARGRHGAGRRREIGHRGLHFRDDLGGRLLGALGLEIAAEACLLVGHGREGSTPHVYPIFHS